MYRIIIIALVLFSATACEAGRWGLFNRSFQVRRWSSCANGRCTLRTSKPASKPAAKLAPPADEKKVVAVESNPYE